MTLLHLIRHGETLWNADGRFQGHQDVALNDTGRTQARAVAEALARKPLAAIYTSDLCRASETATLIAAHHGLTPIPDPRLREALFGEWEGHSLPEITARWPDVVAAWRQNSLRTRPPGGETLEQLQTRVADLLREVVERHPDGEIALVGHGGSVRAVITLALGVDLTLFRRLQVDNCSLSTVGVQDDRYTLMMMNDTCHLMEQAPRGSWDETGEPCRQALKG